MKKKLLVFALTICMLISFIACGETNEPIITETPESSSSSNTAGEETIAETETTATEATATETTQTETTSAPLIFPGFANIGFASIRDMIEILKKGEVNFKDYADFADNTWLEIDFDRFYELGNVPEDYYELAIEWTGKNDYLITYVKNVDMIDDDTPLILFEQFSTREDLDIIKNWMIMTEDEILKQFPDAQVTEETTEYGVLKTYTVDESTYYKRMDVYDKNGELLWIYYKWGKIAYDFLFNFSDDMYYCCRTRGVEPDLEMLLSLTPVKVEVDG